MGFELQGLGQKATIGANQDTSLKSQRLASAQADQSTAAFKDLFQQKSNTDEKINLSSQKPQSKPLTQNKNTKQNESQNLNSKKGEMATSEDKKKLTSAQAEIKGETEAKKAEKTTVLKKAEKAEKKKTALETIYDSLAGVQQPVAAANRYLQKLEEMGIEREEVAAAVSQFSPNEFQLHPEEIIQELQNTLSVETQETQKLSFATQNFLTDIANEKFAEDLKQNPQMIQVALKTQDEQEKQVLAGSLSQLQKDFFSPRAQPQVATQGMAQASKAGAMSSQGSAINPSAMSDQNFNALVDQAEVSPHVASKGLDLETELLMRLRNLEESTGDLQAPPSTNSQTVAQSNLEQKLQALLSQDQNSSSFSQNSDVPFSMKESSSAETAVGELGTSSLESGSSFSQQMAAQQAAKAMPDASMAGATGIAKVLENRNTIEGKIQDQQNVQNMINSTQSLIRDGGGEMKVKLTPEGMGEVNLKVKVNDGKVDIQMVTESREAKKLLEAGLNDLRSNLESHRLNLDNFKVDVSGKTSQEHDSLMNQQQEFARNNAREFLGQFRQQNQNFRQGFFEMGGVGYRSPDRSKDIRSDTINPGRQNASARRLDLVA